MYKIIYKSARFNFEIINVDKSNYIYPKERPKTLFLGTKKAATLS